MHSRHGSQAMAFSRTCIRDVVSFGKSFSSRCHCCDILLTAPTLPTLYSPYSIPLMPLLTVSAGWVTGFGRVNYLGAEPGT